MFLIDQLLLVAGILMILGIVSSKFSSRIGLPGLVIFIVLGMLAGSEGIGRIDFENYQLAHGIGTVALALILFDGGLRSPLESLRICWKPSALLATLGVLLTSVVTGIVAAYVLDVSLLEGLLLGAIVGSTDAAAVFSLLRSAGIRLRKRLSATLELESGANDPMAIFLTIGLIEVLADEVPLGVPLLRLLALQMGIGLIVGYGMGRLAVILINRINLGAAALYPVLTASCGVFVFGLAAVLHGSGFLAIYVAGVVIGNSRLVFQKGTFLFQDGVAWAGQITMFVVLGLLSTPSALVDVAAPGLLIAGSIIFIARPLAVVPLLLPFKYSPREILLVSWVGLKGAVPIILATYPLIFELSVGPLLFNVVFFVVLLSAIVQGSSLSWVARLLKLEEAPAPEPPLSLEISSLRNVDADIVDYAVGEESRAAGRLLRELALPEGAVVAMIARSKAVIPPRGSTRILPGDHVFMVVDRESREPVDHVFTRSSGRFVGRLGSAFPLRGTATVGEVSSIYEVDLDGQPDQTLEQLLFARRSDIAEGEQVQIGKVGLRVRELRGGRIVTVELGVGANGDHKDSAG